MHTTVNLKRQLGRLAVKIGNKPFHDLLTPELEPAEVPVTQVFPQLRFGPRHVPAQRASVCKFGAPNPL